MPNFNNDIIKMTQTDENAIIAILETWVATKKADC